MSLKELREVTVQIRRINGEIGKVNTEAKSSPLKPLTPAAGRTIMARWEREKKRFEARSRPLKEELARLQTRREELLLAIDDKPISKVSLARMIDALTTTEAIFREATWQEAWDHLSGVIDYLEEDLRRIERAEDNIRAAAWDEGYEAADNDAPHSIKSTNPYRSRP